MSALAKITSRARAADTGPPRTVLRGGGIPRVLRPLLTALLAAGLLAAGLNLAADIVTARHHAAQTMALAGDVPGWSEIHRPLPLYDLAGTVFSRLAPAYRARRHNPDGTREDMLTFGKLGSAKPYLQLSLTRVGTAARDAGPSGGTADDLGDAVARLAGTHGLTASRIRAAASVDTRLGRIEAADLLLWSEGSSTPCLGFRGAAGEGGLLRLAGLACEAPGRPMSRAALACAIDRIDLLSAGDDEGLRAVFVAAQRRDGSTCLEGSTGAGSLMASQRRLGWLNPDGDMPPLRGLFESSRK